MDNERSPAATLAALLALGGGGYLAYKYWYLPAKLKQAIDDRALQIQMQNPGMTRAGAYDAIGQVGCMGLSAYLGIPPQASGGMCADLGPLLGQAAGQAPKLLAAIGGGAGAGVAAAGKGVASAAVQIGMVPVQILGGTGKVVGGAAKSVVRDVGKGAKSVVNFFGKLF